MSKHSSAEGKLHISKQLRQNAAKATKRPAQMNEGTPIGLPPKGSNSNNQYR